jgi:hypothetical protein
MLIDDVAFLVDGFGLRIGPGTIQQLWGDALVHRLDGGLEWTDRGAFELAFIDNFSIMAQPTPPPMASGGRHHGQPARCPAGGTTPCRINLAQTFTAAQTISPATDVVPLTINDAPTGNVSDFSNRPPVGAGSILRRSFPRSAGLAGLGSISQR